MKKILIAITIILSIFIGMLCSCDVTVGTPTSSATAGDVTSTIEIEIPSESSNAAPIQRKYTRVFEMQNQNDIVLKFDTDADWIYHVMIGDTVVSPLNYRFVDKTLTIYKDEIASYGISNKTIKVQFVEGGPIKSFNLMIVDKIIKTCDDFQGIRDHLDWHYVLGNDLDFSDADNFYPIGNDAQQHYNEISMSYETGLAFTGSLNGLGHTVSNLTANADDMTDAEIFTETNVNVPYEYGSLHYDKVRPCFGIFMLNKGTIENICFKNCTVRNSCGTVMGLVVAANEGTIENVKLDGGRVIGADMWLDFNCFIGGFAGTNGAGGNISNCISLVNQISADMTGTLARAFVGKSWGTVALSYARSDGIRLSEVTPANPQPAMYVLTNETNPHTLCAETCYGFGYLAIQDGVQYGEFYKCATLKESEMLQSESSDIYASFSTNVWSKANGTIPSLIIHDINP